METFIIVAAVILLYGLFIGWKQYHELETTDAATLAAMRRGDD